MQKYQAAKANGKALAVQVITTSELEAHALIAIKMLANGLYGEHRIWRAGGYKLITRAI